MGPPASSCRPHKEGSLPQKSRVVGGFKQKQKEKKYFPKNQNKAADGDQRLKIHQRTVGNIVIDQVGRNLSHYRSLDPVWSLVINLTRKRLHTFFRAICKALVPPLSSF